MHSATYFNTTASRGRYHHPYFRIQETKTWNLLETFPSITTSRESCRDPNTNISHPTAFAAQGPTFHRVIYQPTDRAGKFLLTLSGVWSVLIFYMLGTSR